MINGKAKIDTNDFENSIIKSTFCNNDIAKYVMNLPTGDSLLYYFYIRKFINNPAKIIELENVHKYGIDEFVSKYIKYVESLISIFNDNENFIYQLKIKILNRKYIFDTFDELSAYILQRICTNICVAISPPYKQSSDGSYYKVTVRDKKNKKIALLNINHKISPYHYQYNIGIIDSLILYRFPKKLTPAIKRQEKLIHLMNTKFNPTIECRELFSKELNVKIGDDINTTYGTMKVSSFPEEKCKLSDLSIIVVDDNNEIVCPIYDIINLIK